MKTRKISFLAALFFLTLFCTCFANERFMSDVMEKEYSIKTSEVEDGKIYVTSDMVFVTSNGIFVNFQGNVMLVNR
jgi:hypothetical protein